ncbi:putative Transcriptional regulator, LysR family [Vibrio nigripulchritudo SOn1]|uniref:Transcriptional regulator, LysR family n=1 Tax=Vibrio nigripulchritudo SOn1 TaxID=1238450 RepID=A0AAV2VM63_9VIBR|nr:LysR family transcriptional regulator [Vibrio nigripulchritudo]CCO45720.1 putative Transcriptional regulator, LysR family [Vibrio nigripulchritudo SOn1]
MAKDLFASLDLNLLRTFLILSQELNMRKASERLFVSQPAISQALQKLRNHFDDELFVKSRNGMKATAFAEELAERITPHLDGLANAVNLSHEFNPRELDHTIKIALSSPVLFSVAGKLYQKLNEEAPNADIQFLNWGKNTCQEIEKGEVLFGVNYQDIKTSKTIYSRHLADTKAVLLVRQEHPLKASTVTPEEAVQYPLASLIIPDVSDNEAASSRILKARGLKHHIAFRSEFPFAVIDVVRNTDMCFPSISLFPVEEYPYLRAIEIDIEDKHLYGYPLEGYYHLKNRNNPIVNWLHECLKTLLSER